MIPSWNKQVMAILILSGTVIIFGVLADIELIFVVMIFAFSISMLIIYTGKKGDFSIKYSFPQTVTVNDVFDVNVSVEVTRGIGIFNFYLPVYKEMEIRDGTNVHMIFKGFRKRKASYKYKIEAMRRGVFNWKEIVVEYSPIFGKGGRFVRKIEIPQKIYVLPKISIVKRTQIQLRSKTFVPRLSYAMIGPDTNDFETIREYSPGDSYKKINWKASARNLLKNQLMVNVYEKEGMKTYIFLLDVSFSMLKGTTFENPLEYAIPFILSATNYLLSKNNSVGYFQLSGNNLKTLEYYLPSTGSNVFEQIRKRLLLVEGRPIPRDSENLIDRRIINTVIQNRPKILILTNIDKLNLRRIRTIAGRLRSFGAELTIIDIRYEGIIASRMGEGAELIYKKVENNKYGNLKVLSWDPYEESLGRFLLRTAKSSGW